MPNTSPNEVPATPPAVAPPRRPGIPLATLQQMCAPLADALLNQGADEAALARLAPGGAENRGRGPRAWLRYYGMLQRLHASQPDDDAPSGETGAAFATDADLSALVTLGNEPELVPVGVNPDGSAVRLAVHPKGVLALLHTAAREATMRVLGRRLAWLHEGTEDPRDPADLELMLRVADEIAHQQLVILWVLTTPGADLPAGYEGVDEAPDVIPARLRALSPVALLGLQQAAARVN